MARSRSLWVSSRAREAATKAVAAATEPGSTAVPLLGGRALIDGRPTAYLCRDFACRLPVTDPAALLAQLGG